MPSIEHLVDLLASADVESPGPGHVEIQRVCIGRDTQMALFQHPPSRIVFPELRLGVRATLRVSIGVKPAAWSRLRGPITFEVLVGGRTALRREVDPRRAADRRWIDERIELGAVQRARLEFRTTATSCEYAWAAWGDPRIEYERAPARRDPPAPRRHVFLIAADAFGADRLRHVRTPNLDRLASDGSAFEHARVQSPATLASYASMLTSRHVPEHGISGEWGPLPADLPSLPALLRDAGYHTVIAASEAELATHDIARLFDERLPCLANPAQDGAMTDRQVERWLDRLPDRPCFAFIQYFDTHPPHSPPAEFRAMYYNGDPASPSRRHRPEDIALIRGVESVQAIEQALPVLERGEQDYLAACRLAAAGRMLAGDQTAGPDLAAHLGALGPSARRGLTPRDFGRWLVTESEKLRDGSASAELVAWMHDVLPALRGIESEILGWLDGVVDARYPVALHHAAVSYVDARLGTFMSLLEERGLYDGSDVIFTSPHGEVFAHRGINFHHHVLLESVLRVPLVIKPAGGSSGRRVAGVFDSVDLLPTILEMLGLPVPPGAAGLSRWVHVRDGSAIPPHPSVAVGNHGAMWSWFEEPHKLLVAEHPHAVSPEWRWKPGDRALFDAKDGLDAVDRLAERRSVADGLEARLRAWRDRLRVVRRLDQ